uniref:Reverse transcriptase domain-containing protein n=1 Tax=Triticum urartu TaxID=4572 RepID=A0A8R7PSC9_TRIUA
MRTFLEGDDMLEVVNSTVLVLIPKIKNPQDLTQYRPISLCNVLYKLASKVLALRLRPVLHHIIAEEQTAFVPGRLISDNVLTAYECIHYLKKKKGKSGDVTVKLDMAKPYDRVEWSYLRAMMNKLGFAEAWIDRVMVCVQSVSFSVRANGQFSSTFRPTRGIRQGDPISPYLFLICAEGLSCLLKFKGPVHLSRGVRVGVHAPWVSHLLFTDDCLVFTQATVETATRLHNILDIYKTASGQMVNCSKSAIFFSANCTDETKAMVHVNMEIETEALVEKYLGLPTAISKSSDVQFEHIATNIRKLVNGYVPKLLSSAAREVLIKAVCQAIPTYSMSCFRLSKKLCKKLTNIVARFFWGR